jgi:RimJ/RimL family protein N-acetyltransferase
MGNAAAMSTSPALEPVPMPIETPRLLLRPYDRDDAERLGAAVSTAYEHLRPWMPWATPDQSTEQSLEIIAGMQSKWALRTDLTLGIFERADGELLGGSGLHRMDWAARTFEIGYWIHPDHEGLGYVTETARALTDYAFDVLRAERVEIRLDPTNLRSQAVPKRLEFLHEGTLRRSARGMDGALRDTQIHAVIRSDWRPGDA